MLSPSDVTVIVAPAGFGKTRLATKIAESSAYASWCDCSRNSGIGFGGDVLEALAGSGGSSGSLAQGLADIPGRDEAGRAEIAMQAWTQPSMEQSTFVFDNFEELEENDPRVDLVAALVARRPANRRIVICSRRPLPRKVSRLLAPAETRYVYAAELLIPDHDAGTMLRNAGANSGDIERSVRIAGGWPIALLLLCRLSLDGRLSEALSGFATAYDSLFTYLISEYIASMSPQEFDALLLAATLPECGVVEISALAKMDARQFAGFLDRCPFITVRDGVLEAHAIVRALTAARYASSRESLFSRAVEGARERGDWMRAAELAIHSGAPGSAIRDLCNLEGDVSPPELPRLVQVLHALGRDAVLEEPRLWASTLDARRFRVPLAELVAEGRRAFVSTSRVREAGFDDVDVVRQFVSVLLQAGRLAEARDVIERARPLVAGPDAIDSLDLMSVAIDSMTGQYSWARERFAQAGADDSKATNKFVDLIDATAALRSGRYDEGLAILEEVTSMQRRKFWIAPLLVSLSNLAYEAWIYCDEERFTKTVAELKATVLPGLEPAWRFWLDAATGEASEPTGYEAVAVVTIGYLFLACHRRGTDRLRFCRLAARHAEQSGDVGLRVVSQIAVAEYDQENRRAALRELRSLAAGIDLVPFKEAVNVYVDENRAIGSLEGYVAVRLRQNALTEAAIRICLARAAVFRSDILVSLTLVESALVQFLAAYQRVASRQVICDALWPDFDPDAAAKNLKVVVHRVRKKLGTTTLVSVANGYCLGPHVQVDLFENERAVRDAQGGKPTSRDAEQLATIGESVADRFNDEFFRYEWYVGIDRRLRALRRSALLIAARAFSLEANTNRARELCLALIQDDQADDEAHALLALCNEHHIGQDAGQMKAASV